MRGGPKSSSRRTWRSLSAVSAIWALALAGACGGGGPTTGVRPGGGGAGGSSAGNGSGGNGSGSGGSSATGNGGSGSGGIGALTDGGAVDGLPAFDGGVCTDDQGVDPTVSAASGTFSGAATGAVCSGGATADVQSVPAADGGAPTIALFIDSIPTGDPAARIRFQSPASALDGGLSIYIGLPAASPGTYTQDTTCGNVALFADLPGVDPSVCATDGGDCPDGCELIGFPETCTPSPAETDYVALASSDCLGDSMAPVGAWTVTLTSLTSEPDAGTGVVGSVTYKVHGTLTATLVDQAADPGAPGVSLTLTF